MFDSTKWSVTNSFELMYLKLRVPERERALKSDIKQKGGCLLDPFAAECCRVAGGYTSSGVQREYST